LSADDRQPTERPGLDRSWLDPWLAPADRIAGPLLAILGGVAWALCFGSRGLWVVPWLALTPLVLLLGVRRATALVYLHGTAFWIAALYWIVPTIITYGKVPWPLAALGLLLLAGFLSFLFWLPFGWFGRRLWQAGGWRLYLGVPALWTALEWMREHILSGFPWNLAAHAVTEVPGALPLSAWIGAYGVGFVVVAMNVALTAGLVRRRGRPPVAAAGVVVALLTFGAVTAPRPQQSASPAGQAVRVLQPDIHNLVDWDPERAEANYRKALAMTAEACEDGALVVLPESVLWPYEYYRHPQMAAALHAIAEGGCQILVNSIVDGDGGYYNSVLMVGAEGVTGRYDKRHLVPFGEYVPFEGVLPFLDKLARAAGDFAAADEAGLVAWDREQLGPAICYEVIYPGSVAEQVRAGATVLVTVTNDAWYGDTTAPWQHLAAARWRAAENHRPMLRAAITGVSAVIGPDGRVRQQLGVDAEGVIATRVAGRTDVTPYSRAPWLVPGLSTLLALLAWLRPKPTR
jgi:apolipoprotein N-acyltransferase